jgi:hypothetical protein
MAAIVLRQEDCHKGWPLTGLWLCYAFGDVSIDVLKEVLNRREDKRFPRIFFCVELIQAFREDRRRQKKSSFLGNSCLKSL